MDIQYEIISTALSVATTGLITGFFIQTKRAYNRILNQLKLARIDIQAMDYALEMESGNGYSKYKETKKSELIHDIEFVNGDLK